MDIQSIYDKQGRPGVLALRIAAKRKGLQISEAEAVSLWPNSPLDIFLQPEFHEMAKLLGGQRGYEVSNGHH